MGDGRAGSERWLLLLRHGSPEIRSDEPAATWPLSAEGRVECEVLAGQLARQPPDRVVASEEPKAASTGRHLARFFEIPFGTARGLHEHDRAGVPFFEPFEAFETRVREMLESPAHLVFGRETADEAHARFRAALDEVVGTSSPDERLAVVSHGTVMALTVARANGLDAYEVWRDIRPASGFRVAASDLLLLAPVS